MGKSSAPAAPDYRGAAEEQSAASERIAQQQTRANRPTLTTPWGSSTWQETPGGQWTQDIKLGGQQQQALDDQMAIQAGRSGIAKGMLGQANQEMGTPENFWDTLPGVGGTPNVPNFYGQGLPSMGGQPDQRQGQPFPTGGPQTQGGANGGMAQGQAPGQEFRPPGAEGTLPGYGQMGGFGQTPEAQQYQAEDIQRGVEGAEYNQDFAQTQYDRQMSLAQPQMDRKVNQLETQLRNQGLSPGTPAYDNAVSDLRNNQGEQQSRMQQDAMRLGADEQQRQFGRNLQGGQFGNQASQQALNQQLGIGGQQFGEQSQQQQLSNQQRQQQFGELQQLGSMRGGAAQAQFDRQMQTSNLRDRQRQQLGQEQLAFGGQGFDQQMRQASFQNQLRQQSVAEQMQKEGWSLNKINAMLSGQQIGMPQMPSFMGASAGQAANYLGAAQSQGSYAMDAANMEAQQRNAVMGAIGNIGGGMMMGM